MRTPPGRWPVDPCLSSSHTARHPLCQGGPGQSQQPADFLKLSHSDGKMQDLGAFGAAGRGLRVGTTVQPRLQSKLVFASLLWPLSPPPQPIRRRLSSAPFVLCIHGILQCVFWDSFPSLSYSGRPTRAAPVVLPAPVNSIPWTNNQVFLSILLSMGIWPTF